MSILNINEDTAFKAIGQYYKYRDIYIFTTNMNKILSDILHMPWFDVETFKSQLQQYWETMYPNVSHRYQIRGDERQIDVKIELDADGVDVLMVSFELIPLSESELEMNEMIEKYTNGNF